MLTVKACSFDSAFTLCYYISPWVCTGCCASALASFISIVSLRGEHGFLHTARSHTVFGNTAARLGSRARVTWSQKRASSTQANIQDWKASYTWNIDVCVCVFLPSPSLLLMSVCLFMACYIFTLYDQKYVATWPPHQPLSFVFQICIHWN